MIKPVVIVTSLALLLLLLPGCGCGEDGPEVPAPTPVESPAEALEIAAKFCPVIHLSIEEDNLENFQPDPIHLMVDLTLLRDLNDPAFAEKTTITGLLERSQSEYYLDVPELNPRSASVEQYKAGYDIVSGNYRPTVYARAVYGSEYTVLQYWLFYYLNDWRNVHEGDWELVQLNFPKRPLSELLSEDVSPVFVAYSQHQSGQRMPWTEMVSGGLVADNHPSVYVARGSHANYFSPGQFWAGLDFDDTGQSAWREIGLDELDIILLSEITDDITGQEWLDFRGYWGEYIGFSIDILDLRFWQHGPFGPHWTDEGRISDKWHRLEQWAAELPEYPAPFWTSFIKVLGDWSDLAVFHLFSPADLHVYDAQDRHVGLDENGELVVDIPGAFYIQPEGTDYKIILIAGADINEEYRIVVRGTDSGTMDIKAQVPDVCNDIRRFLEYIGVPVTPSLVARAVIRPVRLSDMEAAAPPGVKEPGIAPPAALTARDTVTELEIDDDGDGVFDISSRPGRYSLEAVKPVSSDRIKVPEEANVEEAVKTER